MKSTPLRNSTEDGLNVATERLAMEAMALVDCICFHTTEEGRRVLIPVEKSMMVVLLLLLFEYGYE
jgi:hypothetical protein